MCGDLLRPDPRYAECGCSPLSRVEAKSPEQAATFSNGHGSQICLRVHDCQRLSAIRPLTSPTAVPALAGPGHRANRLVPCGLDRSCLRKTISAIRGEGEGPYVRTLKLLSARQRISC